MDPAAFHIAHAYTPRETGSYGGSNHITTSAPLSRGRLHREAGDALCKPRGKFWGLDSRSGSLSEATCKRCRELAVSLGLFEERG